MPLSAGQTLSFYEILGPLGAGGMGEVYLARDTRLERQVAIKVLPEELADDGERLRRFEREAKTLASLNHPNVAGIHTVDQQGEVCFLALELVSGEDLATRLARGPLPVGEAIDVCRQIAEGLEAAHEAGVVHRDLKPANVRITPEGVVKILDFGLAKPIRPKTSREGTSTAESDSFLMTEEGLVLGTPTYMSPEQARGKPVDRRTDVWAFGCVLFECLTGERVFGGETLSDVIAAVLEKRPELSKLPAATPARVRELVARCLDKDPRTRLRDAGEARVQLELARREPASSPGTSSGTSSEETGRKGRSRAVLWAALGLAAGGLLGVLLGRGGGRERGSEDGREQAGTTTPVEPERLCVSLEELPPESNDPELALSPDGKVLAWTQLDGIHLRRLDSLTGTLAVATDLQDRSSQGLPRALVWSPDGRELAYATEGSLWRLPRGGGSPILIAREPDAASLPNNLVWTEAGLVSVDGLEVRRRSPRGGESAVIHTMEGEGTEHLDGLAALCGDPEGGLLLLRHRVGADDPDTITLLRNGVQRDLLQLDGWSLRKVWHAPGRILIERRDDARSSLWWVPFSLDSLGSPGSKDAKVSPDAGSPPSAAVTGDPVLLVEDGAAPSVALDGSLAYLLQTGQTLVEAVWVDMDGSVVPFGRQHEVEFLVAISSFDGRQVFLSSPGLGGTIWSYDLDRGVSAPLLKVDNEGMALGGSLPDGRLLVMKLPPRETLAYPLQGGGEPERITDGGLVAVSPDGAWGLVLSDSGASSTAMQVLDLAGTRALTPFRDLGRFGGLPTFSPDGRFVLYNSDKTGRSEVHLATFPSGDRDWSVSTDGGNSAWFDATGRTIYFDRGGPPTSLHLGVWRVSLETDPDVRLGAPERVFELDEQGLILTDFLPGEERFVGSRRLQPQRRQIVLQRGWEEGR